MSSTVQGWRERRQWFDDYLNSAKGQAEAAAVGIVLPLFTCPCCGCPTLDERRAWEICWVCWWEDDGQDDYNASVVLGGPNHEVSLMRARVNFQQTLFYRSPKHIFETVRQAKCREDGLTAFNKMLTLSEVDRIACWKAADQCRESYYISRSVTPEVRAEMERRRMAKG